MVQGGLSSKNINESGFQFADYVVSIRHYRVRNWNVKCHVKPNYSLISDLIVNKIQVDILPTLLDNIIQEIFGPASIWPQQRL